MCFYILGRKFVIIEYFFDVIVFKGLLIELKCSVFGFFILLIFWIKDGIFILSDKGGRRIILFEGNFYFVRIVLNKRKRFDSGIY